MPDFPIVDSHVHLYDVKRLAYGWLKNVPKIDRTYLLADFDRARGPVAVDKLVFAEVAVDPETWQVTPVAFRDGMLSVGPWAGPWFPLRRIIDFYTRFQTENSAQAPVQAAALYDAVAALAKAARDRGSTTGADLTAGLEGLTNFEGAGVPITFTAGDREGISLDDLGMYGFTKDQDSAGGHYFPDVDTGGGFFTIVTGSLNLPTRYAYLAKV